MDATFASADAEAYALRSVGISPESHRERLRSLAPWYACFLHPYLPSDRSAPMVDVPCGAGNLLFALQQLGYTGVRGLDGDPGQVELARALGLPAQVGEAIGFLEAQPPGSLARVFSLDFVEHLSREQAVHFCAAARRALVPGGMLLLRTPSADGPFGAHDRYNDLTHRLGLTANAGVQLLQLAGFRSDRVSVVQEAPVPYRFRNRLRRIAFALTTRLLSTWLELCGIGAPSVWTRSMWLLASDRGDAVQAVRMTKS